MPPEGGLSMATRGGRGLRTLLAGAFFLALFASGCHCGPSAPSGLTYSTNPAVYTVGQGIADNVPTSEGGPVDSYGVSPSLPAGLVLDATTGVITGTPTAPSPATDYTVTATNPGGS